MTRLAHDVIVDYPGRRIVIDGTPFPWHTSVDGPTVHGDDDFPTITVEIIADNVTVIEPDGTHRTYVALWSSGRDWIRRHADQIRDRLGIPLDGCEQ